MGNAVPKFSFNKAYKHQGTWLNYLLRLAICFYILCIHLTMFGFGENLPTALWVVLMVHAVIYPHAAYYLSSTTQQETRNILIDTFFYTFCCAIWGYNIVLLVILVGCSNMTNLSVGGIRLLLIAFVFQLLGLLMGGLIMDFYYRPGLTYPVMFVASVGMLGYTAFFGAYIYRINNKLRGNRKQLEDRQKDLVNMNKLAYSVNSNLDLDIIMKGLMDTLETMYPFESLYVVSKTPDQKACKIIGAYGQAVTEYEEATFKELEMDFIDDADSIFISGIVDNRVINIPNLTAEMVQQGAEFDKVIYGIKPCRSILYFPIRVKNEVVAGVAFINYEKTFSISKNEINVIEEYLVQVGTAIKNASILEQAEVSKKQAQYSEQAKGRFLANMSHEIRTPMTAIIGYSEALLDEALTKEEKDKFSQTIIRSSKHLLTIINDILDISKIESSNINVETIDVEMAELISDLDDYVKLQCKEKDLSYQLQIQYPLPSIVQADPTRLKQVLYNLTSNAVKFTEDGWIRIEISYAYEKMVFSIEDSGIGLTVNEQNRIFGAFSQADSSTTRLYGGTGLGLYISRNLVKLMGGELTVESEKGKGSCFTLTLGTKPNALSSYIQSAGMLNQLVEEYKSQQKTLFIPKLSGHVLVAEDNLDNQTLIKRLMKNTGVDVTVVGDGEQAVEKITQQHFDLVFLDMQMPVMGGEEAALKIRDLNVDTPLIAFTANIMKHQVDQYIENGFNQVVEKPIAHDRLYQVMQQYLSAAEDLGAILVVEDNLVNQQIMVRLLKKANPQVLILAASNGQEAIEVCKSSKVDLVFMDMEMPIMGGIEALMNLRQLGYDMPIHMITGHIDNQHKEQSFSAGANGYLVKPVDREQLFQIVHKVFE